MKKRLYFIENFAMLLEAGYFIYGLLFAHWSAIMIAAGYWLEEAVTIVFVAFVLFFYKIFSGKKVFLVKFLFVFLSFFLLHTLFLLILSGSLAKTDASSMDLFQLLLSPFANDAFSYHTGFIYEIKKTLIVISVSVVYLTIRTFFFKKDVSEFSAADFINRSFSSFVITHFVVLFGVGFVVYAGLPNSLAIILIFIKIFIESSGFADKGAKVIAK